MFDKDVYISRRKRLKELVGNGLVLIVGNSESPMSYSDNSYNFIQDSTFLYYFGLNSPDLVGVMDVDSDEDYIFGKEFTMDDIIWMGQQRTFKERAKDVGIENFVELEKMKEILKRDRDNERIIHFTNQYRVENSLKISRLLGLSLDEVNEKFSKRLVDGIIEGV